MFGLRLRDRASGGYTVTANGASLHVLQKRLYVLRSSTFVQRARWSRTTAALSRHVLRSLEIDRLW